MEVKEVKMKEKTITNQILKYLKSLPECFAFKEHGGLYGTSGIPDKRLTSAKLRAPTALFNAVFPSLS